MLGGSVDNAKEGAPMMEQKAFTLRRCGCEGFGTAAALRANTCRQAVQQEALMRTYLTNTNANLVECTSYKVLKPIGNKRCELTARMALAARTPSNFPGQSAPSASCKGVVGDSWQVPCRTVVDEGFQRTMSPPRSPS